jgi:hypothetical protein
LKALPENVAHVVFIGPGTHENLLCVWKLLLPSNAAPRTVYHLVKIEVNKPALLKSLFVA